MYPSLTSWLLLIASSALLSAALTPLARRLAWWLDIVDRPSDRKAVTRRVMPQLGGLPIFLGCWVATISAVMLLPEMRSAAGGRHGLVAAAGGAGLAMLLIGILDDWQGLKPRVKLMLEMALALALVAAGFKFGQNAFPAIGPFKLYWLAIPASVIWIAGVINAVNLIDGVDGLATGTCVIIAAAVALVAAMCGNMPVALAATAFGGACAGFLAFNFSPASMFLGDSGSLFAGATLAVLALGSVQGVEGLGGILIPVLLLGYPAFDTLKVMARRFVMGKPMMSGDRGHIHHRALHHGHTHAQTAGLMYLLAAGFCLPAVGLAGGGAALGAAGAVALLGILVVVGARLGYPRQFSPATMWRQRPMFHVVHFRTKLAAAELALAEDFDSALAVLDSVAPHYGVVRLELAFYPVAHHGNGAGAKQAPTGDNPARVSTAPTAEAADAAHVADRATKAMLPAPLCADGAEAHAGLGEPMRRIVLHPAGAHAADNVRANGDEQGNAQRYHQGNGHRTGDAYTPSSGNGHATANDPARVPVNDESLGAIGTGTDADVIGDTVAGTDTVAGSVGVPADVRAACVHEGFRYPRAGLEAHIWLRPDPASSPALQMERRSEFNALLREFAGRMRVLALAAGSAPDDASLQPQPDPPEGAQDSDGSPLTSPT